MSTGVAIDNTSYQEVTCPSCGTTIKYYDTEGSAYFGCVECQTYFKYEDGNKEIIKKFDHHESPHPGLAFGSTGELEGRKFIVTGLLKKRDNNEGIVWEEYLLFNKEEDSYYVLAVTNGEWTFVWRSQRQEFKVMNTLVDGDAYVALQDNPYKKYDRYTSYQFETLYATGEFDSNVLDDDGNMQVAEYLNYTDLLISETNDEGRVWYRGKVKPFYTIRDAFEEIDTKYIENIREDNSSLVYKYGGISVFFLFVWMIGNSIFNSPNRVYSNNFGLHKDSTAWGKYIPIDVGTFKVHGHTGLDVAINTNVDNQWLELAVTMVNKNTGKTYEFTKVAEYYSGYEGGEKWSEGSHSIDAVLSSVEPGEYSMVIYPYSDSGASFAMNVSVEEHTILYSNFILALLLIIAAPVYLVIKKNVEESNYQEY